MEADVDFTAIAPLNIVSYLPRPVMRRWAWALQWYAQATSPTCVTGAERLRTPGAKPSPARLWPFMKMCWTLISTVFAV